jgi:hypothetical protein
MYGRMESVYVAVEHEIEKYAMFRVMGKEIVGWK